MAYEDVVGVIAISVFMGIPFVLLVRELVMRNKHPAVCAKGEFTEDTAHLLAGTGIKDNSAADLNKDDETATDLNKEDNSLWNKLKEELKKRYTKCCEYAVYWIQIDEDKSITWLRKAGMAQEMLVKMEKLEKGED